MEIYVPYSRKVVYDILDFLSRLGKCHNYSHVFDMVTLFSISTAIFWDLENHYFESSAFLTLSKVEYLSIYLFKERTPPGQEEPIYRGSWINTS